MRTFVFVLIAILSLCTTEVSAILDNNIRFTHISTKDGLSQSTVFDITQDKRGYMWFATFDGLNKYDGYSFNIYRNSKEDSTSIANNSIRSILTDSKGRIWIGTDCGLSLYNATQDCFYNFQNGKTETSRIDNITEVTDSTLLVSTTAGLSLFNIAKHKFSNTTLPHDMQLLKASTLYRKDSIVYVGTNCGKLYKYLINKNKLKSIIKYQSKVPVQSIIQSEQNILWIGTEGEGLYSYDLQNQSLKNYRYKGQKGNISSNYIRTLAFDYNERLWIGTFNDLNIYNTNDDSFSVYTHNDLDKESLSQRSVRSIYADAQGGMWLGTYYGGLNYFHPLKNRFTNIRKMPYVNSLNDNVVSCITEDKRGNLWIGTNDNGINFYNTSEHKFRHYRLGNSTVNKGLESNNIKCIYIDKGTDLVYVGAHAGGLNIIHPSTAQIDHYNVNDSNTPGNVYAICEYTDRELLIGTLHGLYTFNKTTKTIQRIRHDATGLNIPDLRITILYKDSQNRIWIGAENGLQIYTQSAEGLNKYYPKKTKLLSLNSIQDIRETSNKCILICTRNGFYKYNTAKNKLYHFTVNDGLPNNVVYGAEEDSYGQIWLSTNSGLCRYTPSTGAFKTFTVADGIQSNEFNNYSHCRTADGRLYFGGVNGITTFHPEVLSDNPFTPQPVITELLLFNKKVKANDATGILTKNISDTKEITLTHVQNSITLEFVVSNYVSGKHNVFAHRLSGYNEEWYYTRDERKVSYSNLPPGEYLFELKSANNDGVWSPDTSTIKIEVLPAWYDTLWAKLLMTVLVLLIVMFVMRHFWIRKSMQTELELEKRDKLHQEEINQMKMRFFINISHELRTPLTLILAPLQDLVSKAADKWTKQQLKYIERNANRLLHLVNQLMDYRRADLGVFKLRVCHKEIHEPMKEIFSFYEKLATSKQIEYHLESSVENKAVYADRQYMELILNNLLSNAFKYTDNGSIIVTLSANTYYLSLTVSDTGTGIPADKQKRIFERFYQDNNEHIGSGIGLSLVQRLVELHHGQIKLESEVGKGSQFSILIPQDVNAYEESELNMENSDEEEKHTINIKEKFYLDEENSAEEPEVLAKKKGTILVAEDNEDILEYIANGLNPIFHIIKASNGEDALQKIQGQNIDLVITDMAMPVMDGIKLCKQLKQNISTNHIPVVILSAQTDVDSKLTVLNLGADDYIEKPFSLSILTRKIQNILRTRQRVIDHTSKSIEMEPEKMTFSAADEELLTKARDIVKKNIDNSSFSAEDFATGMCMSRSNLHLKLKSITGESASEFIKKIRFGEACRLLKEGKYSISEISIMVGYNTPSYFATSFKKYVGCLPTEYAKKQQ